MKRNRGKNKYSYEGPLIKENRLYIGLNFVFTGINSLIIAFYHFSDKVDFRMNVWMAITMFGAAILLPCFETRKEMLKNSAVISMCIAHFFMNILISLAHGVWWIILIFIFEMMVLALIFAVKHKKTKL